MLVPSVFDGSAVEYSTGCQVRPLECIRIGAAFGARGNMAVRATEGQRLHIIYLRYHDTLCRLRYSWVVNYSVSIAIARLTALVVQQTNRVGAGNKVCENSRCAFGKCLLADVVTVLAEEGRVLLIAALRRYAHLTVSTIETMYCLRRGCIGNGRHAQEW